MRVHMPPDWDTTLDALDRALTKPDARWALTTLTPVVAIRELASWATVGARRRSERSHTDWESLRTDCLEALKLIGHGLHQVVEQERKHLRQLLQTQKKDYNQIREAAHAMIRKLDTTEACGGSWDDLVEASESANHDDFAAQRETFLGVVQLAGHHLDSFGVHHIVAGVLADSANAISRAQTITGVDTIAPPDGFTNFAGMDRADRIALARQLWVGAAREAKNVIWIGYINNTLDTNGPSTIGQVTLLPADWLRTCLRNGSDSDQVPAEAIANRAKFRDWSPTNDNENLIFARIDLGTGPVGLATRDGHRNIEALLDLFGRTDSDWTEAGIFFQFIDGMLTLSSTSATAQQRATQERGSRDYASRSLEAQHGKIPAITFSDTLTESLALRKTLRQTETSVAAVVSTAVRALEFVRSYLHSSDEWYIFAMTHFRDRWVASKSIQELTDSLLQISGADYQRRLLPGLSVDHVERLLTRLIAHGDSISYYQACTVGVDVLNSLQRDWLPARRLRRAARALSSNTAPGLVRQYRCRFAVYLGRLQRCRNSVTHGGSDCVASCLTIERFARHLGIMSLNSFTHALALAEDPGSKLNEQRDRDRRNLQLLEVGNFEKAFL